MGARSPIGGKILDTPHFNAHQDVAYPIPGLVILAANRHFKCLDEMNEKEASEFFVVTRKIRQAQRAALGIETVYYFYNEDTTHHFHLWMVPRLDWMSEFGRSIESVRPVLLHARQHLSGPEHLQQAEAAVEALRRELA